MPAVLPSGTNTYIPDHESSGKMVIDFGRNPKEFALPSYVQYVPVKRNVGYYLSMTVEEAGRIINTDLANFAWPDGADAPRSFDTLNEFNFLPYRSRRFAYDFVLGDLEAEQATWDISAQNMRVQAQKAMTARTLKAVTALLTSGNYDSSHTSAVSSISGNTGTWAASTAARQDIKRSLNTAGSVILKDTLGAVKLDDLILVISPDLAAAMSQSQELVDHIKHSPDALAQVRGELPGRNTFFGLPDKLYGFPVVVEQTVRVTSRKGATKAASYVFGSDKAALISRVGGLDGIDGGPSFSTITCFLKEEMTVERKHDVDDRRVLGRIVDDFDVVMTAPVSGFLFTSCQ